MSHIAEFFASPVGALVYLTLLAAAADFVVGVWAAFTSGTFALDEVAAFLRVHIVGRVLPIFGLLLLGYLVGLVPTPEGLAAFAPTLFTAAGTAAALIYIAETFGSILASLKAASNKSQPTPDE